MIEKTLSNRSLHRNLAVGKVCLVLAYHGIYHLRLGGKVGHLHLGHVEVLGACTQLRELLLVQSEVAADGFHQS